MTKDAKIILAVAGLAAAGGVYYLYTKKLLPGQTAAATAPAAGGGAGANSSTSAAYNGALGTALAAAGNSLGSSLGNLFNGNGGATATNSTDSSGIVSYDPDAGATNGEF